MIIENPLPQDVGRTLLDAHSPLFKSKVSVKYVLAHLVVHFVLHFVGLSIHIILLPLPIMKEVHDKGTKCKTKLTTEDTTQRT
jgi:hypothetical protein